MSTIIRGSGDTTFGGTIQSTGIDDNATSTAITIDASENVGVGTATPLDVCHIQGASTKGNVVIGQVPTTGEPYIDLWRDDTSIGSTNLLGRITFSGSDNTSSTRTTHAKIEGQANGTHSAGNNPTQLKFYTTPVSSETMVERLAITSDGRGLSPFTSRAWVNLNGAGTIAIRDSHNVSSITDNGTGDYTITFANAMPNTDFIATAGGGDSGGGGETTFQDRGTAKVVGSYRLYLKNAAGTVTDRDQVYLSTFANT